MLIVRVTLALALATATAVAPTTAGCTQGALISGCSSDGSQLTITGTETTPGSPGGPAAPAPVTEWPPRGGGAPPAETEWESDDCSAFRDSRSRCVGAPLSRPEPEDELPPLPALTATDLAQFAPDGSVMVGEPGNVGIAGLPANFVARAAVQTIGGTLLSRPITVRFTPVAFDFDFGDGTRLRSPTGGREWAQLRQPQFTPTDTSHVYEERGVYRTSVDVRYRAEVDVGTGWIAVEGELTAHGPAREVRIFEAYTALVAHTCDERPRSPGC